MKADKTYASGWALLWFKVGLLSLNGISAVCLGTQSRLMLLKKRAGISPGFNEPSQYTRQIYVPHSACCKPFTSSLSRVSFETSVWEILECKPFAVWFSNWWIRSTSTAIRSLANFLLSVRLKGCGVAMLLVSELPQGRWNVPSWLPVTQAYKEGM